MVHFYKNHRKRFFIVLKFFQAKCNTLSMKLINIQFLVVVFYIFGCATYPQPKEFIINRNSSPSPIVVSIGDAVVVKVKTNASTGYKWNVSGADKEVLLESRNVEQTDGEKLLIGKANEEIFVFRCINRGLAVVKFEYKRAWEKTSVDKFDVKIEVQ